MGLQVRIFNLDGIRQYIVYTWNILGLKHKLQGQVPGLQIQLQWKPVKDKRDRKAFIWVWVIFWVRLKAFQLKTLRIKTVWR